MSTPQLSVVIPCYNEETRLKRTLEETIAYLTKRGGTSEIIVVSDGSKDKTKALAEDFLAQVPQFIEHRVEEYFPNHGKGHAVKVGMMLAKGERILFMDADYSVPLEDLAAAEAILDKGLDIAIGSRALEDTKIVEHQSFLRERFAKLFGLMQRTYLGLKLKDTQCGFKLFTYEAAHEIFPRLKLASVIFDGEVLWLAKKLGFKTVEFPVEWTHDQDTRLSYTPLKAVKVLLDVVKVPWLHINTKRVKR